MEIAVGVLLGLAGLVLAGLVAASVAGRRTRPPADPIDDLPDFLEFPPGSTAPSPAASTTATDGLVALSPPPGSPVPHRQLTTGALAALAGSAVLLLVAAVVVALLPGSGRRGSGEHRPAAEASSAGDEARLRFGGIVLEERAVGITVTYPELTLEAESDGSVASLELPTWNCLAAEAPDDPADAGCVPGRTEYAELSTPDLEVTHDGQAVRIAGAFATTTRPTGGQPEPTDRTYDVVVTVSPEGSAATDRWVPAAGDLELGDRRASAVEGELRIGE